ncbi:MAG: hypothetical protein FWD83_04625 [Promicromonosporaceae bacterium]|nr:hypothetical protein [Promicromonosporaceae bacterium]
MAPVQSATETRANFKSALDLAEQGVSVPVLRSGHLTALVDANRLRESLMHLVNPDPQITCGEQEWWATIPNIPSILATGTDFDSVVADLISAVREYAFDWNDDLRLYPNHGDNWGFVQIVSLSTDDQLRDWLTR